MTSYKQANRFGKFLLLVFAIVGLTQFSHADVFLMGKQTRVNDLQRLGREDDQREFGGSSNVDPALEHRQVAAIKAIDVDVLRAGAYAVDIAPAAYPVIVNGNFFPQMATQLVDSLHARCLVLSDGKIEIAICVVDSCVIPREFADEAKRRIQAETDIPADHILISATHTHSAPSLMQALGVDIDEKYTQYLLPLLAEGVKQAQKNLEPARVGWTAFDDFDHTHCRRWIRRPDRLGQDPFGELTMRANMHPGHQNPDAIGPSGPVDPGISILSVQSTDGRPIALFANYSMHYYGVGPISSDYFGRFAEQISQMIVGDKQTAQDENGKKHPPFVAAMSQGTSGDLQWMDYGEPRQSPGYVEYAKQIAVRVHDAYKNIAYHESTPLGMLERDIQLKTRAPDEQRLAWSREKMKEFDGLNGGKPTTLPQLYARDQFWLDEHRTRSVKLQAIRIGDYAIAAIPCEVYGITGLKLKLQSPFAVQANFGLANGEEGYIPPPEQHKLGGYTTWPTRTAMLEPQAEPQIVATLLDMLEELSGRKRKPLVENDGAYPTAVIDSKPFAYWRMNDIAGWQAVDHSSHGNHATYEPGVAYYLPGPDSRNFSGDQINRCAHFAGGGIKAQLKDLGNDYAIEMWFWNGLPDQARETTGVLFTRPAVGDDAKADQIAISGQGDEVPGRLVFLSAAGEKVAFGGTRIRAKAWNYLSFVRSDDRVRVYLNGNREPDIDAEAKLKGKQLSQEFFVGMASVEDRQSSFEGKIDEVAIYNRALTADEFAAHFLSADIAAPAPLPVPQEPSTVIEKPSGLEDLQRYAKAILQSKPVAYWPLRSGNDGKQIEQLGDVHEFEFEKNAQLLPLNAAANNFSGGRIKAAFPDLKDTYSIELWFLNQTPNDARLVTGYFISRGPDGDKQAPGDHLGIGGTHGWQGRLVVFNGNQLNDILAGETLIAVGTWNHVVMIRENDSVRVYLNGQKEPEIAGKIAIGYPQDHREQLFIGGRSDNFANFIGMIDQVAVYDRALTPDEIAEHFLAAKVQSEKPKPDASEKPQPDPGPQSPEDSTRSIRVHDGFQVELVAAEPLIKDPVAIDWDVQGRMWVVEMADYPSGMDGNGKPGGRVRVLEDSNGDGRYDKSTLFLDGLNFPNGIITWRNGVLITAAPEILYAEDTDGDGRADVRKTLYSGFLEGNQQLRVNGLRWGLDNWIHCASGSHHAGYGANTGIQSAMTGDKVPVGSRDFRIRPDQGLLDPQTGPSQYGRNRDDWGNWFGEQNSFPLWHYVLSDQYIRRNPYFAPPDPRRVLSDSNPQVYPAKSPEKRFHSFEQSGRFTSACSGMIYRDELLFPRTDTQHAFTCEPFHNLVQHNLLSEDGVSFKMHRDDNEGEFDFFASEDRWCRPVMVRTGPDGALWIVDMYRFMIEHPEWLNDVGKNELRPFFRSGEDFGRIYRVFPKSQPPRSIPKLAELTTKQLVAKLADPNGWVRDKAQQLLIWRSDESSVELLKALAADSTDPRGRLHAICTLDGLGKLDPQTLIPRLQDDHPGVRREAIRLAESINSQDQDLLKTLVNIVDESDAKVRLQLACTLGEFNDPLVGPTLAKLVVAARGDPYTTAAVISSISEQNVGQTLLTVLSQHDFDEEVSTSLVRIAAKFKQDQPLREALQYIVSLDELQPSGWQWRALASMLNVIELPQLRTLTDQPQKLDAILQDAYATALNQDAIVDLRCIAIQLLARQPDLDADVIEAIGRLLGPRNPPEIQSAVVSRLSNRTDAVIAEILLEHWNRFSPPLRQQISNILLSRESWTVSLLDQIESKKVAIVDIDVTVQQRLVSLKNETLLKRAQQLLASSVSVDRQQVIEQYRAALVLDVDKLAGEKIYTTKCANCHRIKDVGKEIGPNLAALTDKSVETLLVSILDPSRAVESKYLNYIVETQDGRSQAGVIASETGTSITLLTTEGKRIDILRSDIEELYSSGKSLMPDGLEKEFSLQDFANLIGYLRSALSE